MQSSESTSATYQSLPEYDNQTKNSTVYGKDKTKLKASNTSLILLLLVVIGIMSLSWKSAPVLSSVLGSSYSPPHEMRSLRFQINATALPQTVELDLPRGFFVTGITVLPIELSEYTGGDESGGNADDEDGVIPTVQWFDHELKTIVMYENTKSYLKIYGPSGAESRSDLDYFSVFVSICNDQRHEVAASIMQVAPTSDFSLPRYISILPQNTTLPRRGLTVVPIHIQDEQPHVQAWDGLETNYVGPALNVYSVTVNTKVPPDKNDLVAFIENVGPETGGDYALARKLPWFYKTRHISVNVDTIPDYEDSDEMILGQNELGSDPCEAYPWSLYNCKTPVITNVVALPMMVKDYQVNPVMCEGLRVSADEKGDILIKDVQACLDEAEGLGYAIEEWHLFVTYSLPPNGHSK
eukprot:CAMPEP_0114492490 /NCGR_PEP_ID=MMETSP0109-20121206/3580_1 /TAXON_ID=29199 /ORGANISM="Chlorarachnion reptans, Strain CCCM449" /LENGTH=409 /DNA_ID=CAMNT_0001669331 /DNA_START=108 /DNA_END=1337 /DNA_ORIENTATION=+